MSTKPIITAADHEDAVQEVERLVDASPDTPEGDVLDVLVTLI